jgi:hypothetical protein
MFSLQRYANNTWAMKAREYYTRDTKTYLNVVPIIEKCLRGDLS